MDLTPDFLPVIVYGKRPAFYAGRPELVFPAFGDTPVVAINFIGTLMKDGRREGSESVNEPVCNAIWALQVFKHNGWEVEIFSSEAEVGLIKRWVVKYAEGLVDRINEHSLIEGSGEEQSSNQPFIDVFVNNRGEYWFGREVDWIEIMERLYRRGFLRKGLLPLAVEENKKDMTELLKEPVFREIITDLKTRKTEEKESRDELIRLIECYIKHPGIVGTDDDLLVRARAEGGLLESVLKLLARDRFDPVGCIILAQQERETRFDQMPPLSQVDLD